MKVIEDKIQKLIVSVGNNTEPYIYMVNGHVQKGVIFDNYKITKIQQLFNEETNEIYYVVLIGEKNELYAKINSHTPVIAIF